ncbi:alpha/beta hydrolase [Gordonia sp. NPDC058843]|uniref:alpha/beta hydrolase n=1 Tax=Gordonia sp. NPDC058843 TaxID=3346648 RepID=UPI0036AF34E1
MTEVPVLTRQRPREPVFPDPSRRARWEQALTRHTIRRLMPHLELNALGIAALRTIVDAPNALARTVPGTGTELVATDTVRAEWVQAPGVRRGGPTILYVHGSAFVLLSAKSHRPLVSRLSDRTGLPAFSVDYRLAPEHPFPAASDDVLAAYEYVLEQGVDPREMVLAGDSAGAHLCVDLASRLARANRPAPAALVVFSPLVDLTLELAAAEEVTRPDPLIAAADCRRLIDLYIGESDRSDQRITLTLDGVTDFPPTLIQAGANEMLSADARHLHGQITAIGGDSSLQIWPGQAHVFQASAALPESAAALRSAAEFICAAIATRATHDEE